MTNLFAISESTATESTDNIGKYIDFSFSQMNPLIDKSSFLVCSTEKARVWSKASHCNFDADQHFLRIERKKEKKKD